ncbi:sensor histidine kinase [Sphingomonas sp. 1P06PA]|uniref:sensor histidine kinase n=1 Tax=Sphingomonas sp. 1P06PA TaxID=554121 RepID=UPI0039A6CE15
MIRSGLNRLPTGLKMLLILTAALLPLGLIALFASIESVETNSRIREGEAHAVAAQGASQLSMAIARQSLLLQQIMARSSAPLDAAQCTGALTALSTAQRFAVDYALFDRSGALVCATDGLSDAVATPPVQRFTTDVQLLPAESRLRFEASGGADGMFAIGEFPLKTLADISRPLALTARHSLALVSPDGRIGLGREEAPRLLRRHLVVTAPVTDSDVALQLTVAATPITAVELLIAILPLTMWLAAALIGWFVVDRLIIRPLLRMNYAIARYEPGGDELRLPLSRTPAHELRALGQSFIAMTERVAGHERELEAGLARQTKLTREVHHRVKNNLQVVSSLINLHARGVDKPDVAAAYASIQRRVDALAVVHRNHFAELEENRGVGLRALVGELAANLRATAPQEASQLVITLDIASASVTQDVAVPVAFLITEIVELAMSCDPGGRIAIAMMPTDTESRMALIISAPGLASEACRAHASLDRFDRVVEGLSRQLRAKLARDADAGRFEIVIPVVPASDAG